MGGVVTVIISLRAGGFLAYWEIFVYNRKKNIIFVAENPEAIQFSYFYAINK
jgi:hypothetical protein